MMLDSPSHSEKLSLDTEDHLEASNFDGVINKTRELIAFLGFFSLSIGAIGCAEKGAVVEEQSNCECTSPQKAPKDASSSPIIKSCDESVESKWQAMVDELQLSDSDAAKLKRDTMIKKWQRFTQAHDIPRYAVPILKSEYLKRGQFDLVHIEEILQITKANKPETRFIYSIIKHRKFSDKVMKLVKYILENVTYGEGELPYLYDPNFITSKAGEIGFLEEMLNNDTFEEWVLDYMTANPHKIRETIAYLQVLFKKPDYRQVHSFAKVKGLAKRLNIDVSNPVFFYNLAYAIDILGEEATCRLHSEYNIRFFSRYPKRILWNMLENRGNKPSIVHAFTSIDDGAFSAFTPFRGEENNFDIKIYEVENEQQLYDLIKDGVVMFVEAHGTPTYSQLAYGKDEIYTLDINDKENLSELRRSPKLIVMASCSTGRGINSLGAVLSDSLKTRVFAPTSDTGIKNVILKDGQIVDVEYWNSQRHIFTNGKITD